MILNARRVTIRAVMSIGADEKPISDSNPIERPSRGGQKKIQVEKPAIHDHANVFISLKFSSYFRLAYMRITCLSAGQASGIWWSAGPPDEIHHQRRDGLHRGSGCPGGSWGSQR